MNERIKNIGYVVVSALNRLKLPMNENYDWAETIAIEWFEDLARPSTLPSLATTKFMVGNGSRVFSMPSDFIRHTRIGYRIRGKLYDLTADNSLSFDINDVICETGGTNNGEILTSPQSYLPFDYYGSGLIGTPMYGIGGGKNIAYYRVDQAARQILFSMDVSRLPNGEVVIEYLSSGQNVTSDTLVNPVYVEPCRNYIIWQLCLASSDNKLYGQAMKREVDYHDSMWNSAAFLCPTVEEIIDVLNSVPAFNLGR